MSFLGNVIWLIFGGLIAGLGYIIGGGLLCLTVIGIPFGLQSIRLGLSTFAPFGKEVSSTRHQGAAKIIFDVLWILLFGWEIAMTHLTFALVLATGDHGRRSRWVAWAGVGALFGCAFLLKPPLGGGAVVCAAYLARRQYHRTERIGAALVPLV